jgi:hypothetical protein
VYYLILTVLAAVVAAVVLILEHRGDPTVLERDYSATAPTQADDEKSRPPTRG